MIRQEDTPLVSCPLQPDGLPAYEIDDSQLEVGSSFGNRKCWINTKGTGDAEHLFSVDLGIVVAGSLAVRYARPGRRLALPLSGDHDQTELRPEAAYTLLTQERPGTFTIHPAYQAHSLTSKRGSIPWVILCRSTSTRCSSRGATLGNESRTS